MKILLLDNYDSFTYMLKDYIEQCGNDCMVYRNDDPLLDRIDLNNFDAIVISPGPKKPVEAGKLNALLQQWIMLKPILGICLGHQALGEYFGARLTKSKLPRHGKADKITHNGNSIFDGIPSEFKATRYHSLILENLPESLIQTCTSKNELMGFVHKTLPIWGLQFHPESCQTEFGINLLKNFFNQVKKIAHS
ncbi:MAG: aminodeoxychorismate/anthranilate synthase component II [Bacteroidota bacterium]|nr:aminodeoxychorismate/anthranilate synthase component II [Bacteroidota bacterium]